MCGLSISGVFLARAADHVGLVRYVPNISPESLASLLDIISSSMLVIATFAVGSMVSAYASASRTATPRSFALVVADDVSQNALSSFIGAFIFSIIAIVALKNDFYDQAGRFALFVLTLLVFAIVILTFVRWVDRIARLGRLGTTVDKVENATAAALKKRRSEPTLGCSKTDVHREDGQSVFGDTIGYVQRIDTASLQEYAEKKKIRITIEALPGTFSAPGYALARITPDDEASQEIDRKPIVTAFRIDDGRTFYDDPRFGLVVLSEIAVRALSPAVNDPGTAIDVIGTFVRLFSLWNTPAGKDDEPSEEVKFDRVAAPELSVHDMFDDAFSAIARDGAGTLEVMIRLQKALASLATSGDKAMRDAAKYHARIALARAEHSLKLPEDLKIVRELERKVASV